MKQGQGKSKKSKAVFSCPSVVRASVAQLSLEFQSYHLLCRVWSDHVTTTALCNRGCSAEKCSGSCSSVVRLFSCKVWKRMANKLFVEPLRRLAGY